MSDKKVLMIGFDSAEFSLIKKFSNQGDLPNFSKLLKTGSKITLDSTAEWLAGSPWPSFYTGLPPGMHGIYHSSQWHPELMKRIKVTPNWIDPKPFWRDLSKRGLEIVAIDIPMVFSIDPLKGVEITSWGSHDRVISPSSYPYDLIHELDNTIGPIPSLEEWGPSNIDSLVKQKENMIYAINQVKKIALRFLKDINWNFFIVVFGATHSAGHKFFDSTSVWGKNTDKKTSNLLLQVYKESDKALGAFLDEIDDSILLMVFSLHGMEKNTSKNPLLTPMLNDILGKEHSQKRKYRLIEHIPLRWKYWVTRKLPISLSSKLDSYNEINKIKNWKEVKAFSIDADHQGYIRINLEGREKEGIIEEDIEYKKIINEISSGLYSYTENNTNKIVVKSLGIRNEKFDGKKSFLIPDIIVKWSDTPNSRIEYIKSKKYGKIKWKTYRHSPDGRSGNHNNNGFMIIKGEFKLVEKNHYSILQIAPTIYSIFNLDTPSEYSKNLIIRVL
jgi:predicted AlkP superfamily phosphohydrolase/phosphomutase